MQFRLAHGTVAEHEMVLPLASRYAFWPELLRSMPVKVAVLPTTCSGSNVPSTFDGSSTPMLVKASHEPSLSTTNWLYLFQLSMVDWMLGSFVGLGGNGLQMTPVYATTLAQAPSILPVLLRSANCSWTGGGTVASGTVMSAVSNSGKLSSVKPTNLE